MFNLAIILKKVLFFYRAYGLKETLNKIRHEWQVRFYIKDGTASKNDFVLESLDISSLGDLENFVGSQFRGFGYPIAQYVKDFDEGGLEQFVLDLALLFRNAGCANIIIYSGQPGKLKLLAEKQGIVCLKVHSASDFNKVILSTRVNKLFLHHSYDFLEEVAQTGIKIIEVVHNPYWWQRDNAHLKNLRSKFSKYVSVSNYVTKYMREQLAVPTEKIITIQNFQQRITTRSTYNLGPKLYTFAHVANLNLQKNHILLLKAFSIIKKEFLPDATLLLLHSPKGNSEISTRIVNLISELGLEKSVTIRHPESPLDVAHFLSQSQLFVLPSTFEGFSLASLEAMSLGLPLVLTPCGGYEEIKAFGYPLKVVDGIIPAVENLNGDSILQLSLNPSDKVSEILANAMFDAANEYPLCVFPDLLEISNFISGQKSIDKYLELVHLP